MDVAWQDGVGSFLDSSGTDPSSFASFASDDGGALWSSSADNPLFSGQPVLWESGEDAPADSRISALTADGAGGNDTSALLAGSWIADAGSGFAGGSVALDGGLLWTGAGRDTSSTLTSNGGVGLGALDLGAGSVASQWQQSVNDFASQSATGFRETPSLLWTGASSQPPVTVPVVDGLQAIHLAPADGLSVPTLAGVSPTQLVWTQPSGAPGLANGPTLADAAPTTFPRTLGVPVQSPSGDLPRLGSTP
jgi:hypothetical protein